MSLHRLTAGHGYVYLTRQVAAADVTGIAPGGLGAYYAEHGEAPGQWLGSGLAGVGLAPGDLVTEAQMTALFGDGRHPDSDRISRELTEAGAAPDAIDAATRLGTPFVLNRASNEFHREVARTVAWWNEREGRPACAPLPDHMMSRIRTAVGEAMFEREHGRAPRNHRELGDFVNTQSRLGSSAVAGFDLTFSPVKSVSALWALASPQNARAIEAAHVAAVNDTMAWLEREVAFTRLGAGGVRQVDTRGLIAVAFRHRDSRAGDPDLHTHVAVSNKVQTLDGRWRALDARVLHKAAVAASERYNTRLEAELRDRLGVDFAERPVSGRDRRPVREVVGVPHDLIALWSTRRHAIRDRSSELSTTFQAQHGRPPTPTEAIALAQQATLETRDAKHGPRSETAQRRQWWQAAVQTIGDPAAVLSSLAPRMLPTVDVDVRALAHSVIDRVSEDRSTWQSWHVIAEAQRQVRRFGLPVAQLERTVVRITDIALNDCSIALTTDPVDVVVTEPGELRRRDGASVYTVAGAQQYSSPDVLAAEKQLLDAARAAGRRLSPQAAQLAVFRAEANGTRFTAGQAALVRELATSGRKLQVALAPAGSGKTTALAAFADAWRDEGGTVIGLAPSAAAAAVLRDAIDAPTETVAKFLQDPARYRVDPDTVVIVDEAAMVSTRDLARLDDAVGRRWGALRLVGDDQQLASVAAGGVLRDIAEEVGAARMDTVVRFVDDKEAAASLAVRDGDATALSFYVDRERVHVGDEHTALDSAYRAWASDIAAGKNALLLAGTRDHVAALNTRARADRLARVVAGPEVLLADGTSASAGDSIITRRNQRRLMLGTNDWVKNGDRFTVTQLHDDGAVDARHLGTGRTITLPSDYVAEHVDLGYACTVHTAQGRTADTCHVVVTGDEHRQQLYVAMTRGREANHLHVVTAHGSGEHPELDDQMHRPPAAVDVLEAVLARDGSQLSARTVLRHDTDAYRQIRRAVLAYEDAVAPCGTGIGPRSPLPWLAEPPDPSHLWARYLDARAAQIRGLALEIADDTEQREEFKDRRRFEALDALDPGLVGELAVFRAVTHQRDGASDARDAYAKNLWDRERSASTRLPPRPINRPLTSFPSPTIGGPSR